MASPVLVAGPALVHPFVALSRIDQLRTYNFAYRAQQLSVHDSSSDRLDSRVLFDSRIYNNSSFDNSRRTDFLSFC